MFKRKFLKLKLEQMLKNAGEYTKAKVTAAKYLPYLKFDDRTYRIKNLRNNVGEAYRQSQRINIDSNHLENHEQYDVLDTIIHENVHLLENLFMVRDVMMHGNKEHSMAWQVMANDFDLSLPSLTYYCQSCEGWRPRYYNDNISYESCSRCGRMIQTQNVCFINLDHYLSDKSCEIVKNVLNSTIEKSDELLVKYENKILFIFKRKFFTVNAEIDNGVGKLTFTELTSDVLNEFR